MVLETLFIGSFWTAMVSYVSLSLVKLYAVARPFHFRKSITMRRCIHIVVFSWVMFTVLVLVTLSVTAMVKVEWLRQWSGWRTETCSRWMYRGRNMFIVFCYFLTIISFVITVLYIRRAQRFVDSFSRKSPIYPSEPGMRFPLWKLALNVATFAVLYIFYFAWGVFLQTRDTCFFQLHYAYMMRMLGVLRVVLLLRIIIDPVISFITDYQIRRGFAEWTGLAARLGKGTRISQLFYTPSTDSKTSRASTKTVQETSEYTQKQDGMVDVMDAPNFLMRF